MIKLLRDYTVITPVKGVKQNILFRPITDKEKAELANERRLRSTRRKPPSSSETIERRVSSDRRRAAFSSKV